MDPSKIVSFVSDLLKIGVGSAVAIIVLVFVARSAIAKAVELAGQKELEILKAALAKDLEDKKASLAATLERDRQAATREMERLKLDFGRELERERGLAARDLERFRAELSLVAETRRQVAARKVQALHDIAVIGETLLRKVLFQSDVNEAISSTNLYAAKIREVAHYFEKGVADKMYIYAQYLLDAKEKYASTHDIQTIRDASKSYEVLLDVMREELGVPGLSSAAPVVR